MDTMIKHDGFDPLRKSLSPLVTMGIEKQSSDTLIIALTIPNPTQFHHSILAKTGIDTQVVKRFVWADSNRRVLPPSYEPIILDLDAWEADIRQVADRMLADAQRDPVGFFANDVAGGLR